MRVAINRPFLADPAGTIYNVAYICKTHKAYTVEYQFGWASKEQGRTMCIYCHATPIIIPPVDVSRLDKRYITMDMKDCVIVESLFEKVLLYVRNLLGE